MRFSRLLLPRKFKIIGLLLTLLALVLAVDRFYFDHKYSFLKWKVFSFYSEYLFPRRFVFTRNNQGDELVVLLSLVGLVLLILSKEKFEGVEVNKLRVRAMIWAFGINALLVVFATIFLHGLGYFYFLSYLTVLPLVLYYLFFQIFFWRNIELLRPESE